MSRITSQQETILKTLQKRGHPTARDIYEDVKHTLPRTGRATIYRQLETLCREGRARRVAANGPTRFELMDSKDEHDHLICPRCGAIRDARIDSARAAIEQEHPGAHVVINIESVCKHCR